MRFGSREICNVVFKAKASMSIGKYTFVEGQPVLYIDSAKTSTTEGAATSVYATGGRGNTRLLTWEGEKTLTFTVEDALLSPISFAMLSGAGLIEGKKTDKVHVHTTSYAQVNVNGTTATIDLTDALGTDKICTTAPIFISLAETDGSITGDILKSKSIDSAGKVITINEAAEEKLKALKGAVVFVDYYVIKDGDTVSELQIDAGHFAGYYYVEAETLYRRQDNGKDMPAVLTFPNVKIQSNFSFAMASTGDPSELMRMAA